MFGLFWINPCHKGPNKPGRILFGRPFNPHHYHRRCVRTNRRPATENGGASLTPNLCSYLSFSRTLPLAPLTLLLNHRSPLLPPPTLTIRMGGGPRTYPGGVIKWQWKRMQAKKAKQLLKARLSRERHIYEMWKRAELLAAVSELERPWEPVMAADRAPKMLSVPADEQLKALADRFQKPGGFDMWTDRDGQQLLREVEEDWSGSARFFPKGVVQGVKPYGFREKKSDEDDNAAGTGFQNTKADLEDMNDDGTKGIALRRRAVKENGEVGFARKQRGRHNARRRDYRMDTNVRLS